MRQLGILPNPSKDANQRKSWVLVPFQLKGTTRIKAKQSIATSGANTGSMLKCDLRFSQIKVSKQLHRADLHVAPGINQPLNKNNSRENQPGRPEDIANNLKCADHIQILLCL
jgi:hypothetical protein